MFRTAQVGPCRVMGDGQSFSPRFLLLILACAASLVVKGGAVAVAAAKFQDQELDRVAYAYTLLFILCLAFLPGLLVGAMAVFHCRSKTVKTVFLHPRYSYQVSLHNRKMTPCLVLV